MKKETYQNKLDKRPLDNKKAKEKEDKPTNIEAIKAAVKQIKSGNIK